MSAGIYECNGVYAYALNLEKKVNRKKGSKIVEVYEGPLEGEDLETLLLKMLEKYQTTSSKPSEDYTKAELHYFIFKDNGHIISSAVHNKDELWCFFYKYFNINQTYKEFETLLDTGENKYLWYTKESEEANKIVKLWKKSNLQKN